MTHADDRRVLALGASLALESTAVEIGGALRAAGVRSILLKGPVLVRWLYGSETARTSVDVDLLVDPQTVDTAASTLERLGFERAATGTGAADRPRHASTWDRAGGPSVDLHTTVVGVGVPPVDAWSVLRERTEVVPVGGAELEVPSTEVRLLLVALHAAQHGRREQQPLQDLARALERGSRDDWERASELARRLDAEPAFAAGLDLLDEGRSVRTDLGVTPSTTVESALRATTPPDLALGVDWLVRVPGLRAKLRFGLGKVAPPSAYMRNWSKLARRGPFGLAAAYVWRPFWLLLHAGPAIRAWRKARRETRA